MVVTDQLRHLVQRGGGVEDALPDLAVTDHEPPLVVGQRPRLRQDLLGDRDLPDVVELGRAADPRELVGLEAESVRDRLREVGDLVAVLAELWVAFEEGANQDVPALGLGGQPPAVLLRVHPLVGLPQRLLRVRRVLGDPHDPVRAPDLEPVALLGQREHRGAEQVVEALPRLRRQDAELVPAQAIPTATAVHRRGELRRQTLEQRVSRRVTERVVVVLEPVQVEHRERERLAVVDHRHEVGEQPSAVPDPGEAVGRDGVGELLVRRAIGARPEEQQPEADREHRGRRGPHAREDVGGIRGRRHHVPIVLRLAPDVDVLVRGAHLGVGRDPLRLDRSAKPREPVVGGIAERSPRQVVVPGPSVGTVHDRCAGLLRAGRIDHDRAG